MTNVMPSINNEFSWSYPWIQGILCDDVAENFTRRITGDEVQLVLWMIFPDVVNNCKDLRRTFRHETFPPSNWCTASSLNSLKAVCHSGLEGVSDLISSDTFKLWKMSTERDTSNGGRWVRQGIYSTSLLCSYDPLHPRKCHALEPFTVLFIPCAVSRVVTSQWTKRWHRLSTGINAINIIKPFKKMILTESPILVVR